MYHFLSLFYFDTDIFHQHVIKHLSNNKMRLYYLVSKLFILIYSNNHKIPILIYLKFNNCFYCVFYNQYQWYYDHMYT